LTGQKIRWFSTQNRNPVVLQRRTNRLFLQKTDSSHRNY